MFSLEAYILFFTSEGIFKTQLKWNYFHLKKKKKGHPHPQNPLSFNFLNKGQRFLHLHLYDVVWNLN